MNTHLTKIILTLGTILLMISCGDRKKHFIIKGNISDADTLTLFLERRGHSDITVLDSVRMKGEGDFSFKQEALDYAEFYRLRLGNQSINFSVDSSETIIFKASKATFSSSYEVEGSYNSSRIQEAVMSLAKLRGSITRLQKEHEKKLITDQQFVDSISSVVDTYKKNGSDMILDDYKSTAAYFILFQKIDDMLIFDPNDKKDLNLFRAVATVWDTYYPKSPRTIQLKEYTLNAIAKRKMLENQQATINKLNSENAVNNKDFYAVSLPDMNNKTISTTSLHGKIVVLDFTVYQGEYSVAHNVRLNQAYNRHKSKIEIYQIAFDQDKHAWRNAAANLPWICVRDEQSLNSPLLPKFNIAGLPTTYILNREGEIIKRLTLNDDINAEIAKVL